MLARYSSLWVMISWIGCSGFGGGAVPDEAGVAGFGGPDSGFLADSNTGGVSASDAGGFDAASDGDVQFDGGGGGAGSDAASASGGTGSTGAAGSDAGPCSGANLASDPLHCGSCGHDCLGGDCVAGECQPVLLAPLTQGFTIDETHVYAYSSGSIVKFAKSGGPPTVLGSSVSVWYFAQDFSHVYFAVNGSPYKAYKVPKSGGTPVSLVSTSLQGWDLVIDDKYLYFRSGGGGIFGSSIAIAQGGTFTVKPEESNNRALYPCIQGLYAYWLAGDTSAKLTRVQRAVKYGSGSTQTLATGSELAALAVDSSGLIWLDRKLGLWQRPLASGNNVQLVADASIVDGTAVALDATHAYWTEDSGRIFRVLRSGGSAEQVVAGLPMMKYVDARGLKVDATAIYYQDNVGIYRLAK